MHRPTPSSWPGRRAAVSLFLLAGTLGLPAGAGAVSPALPYQLAVTDPARPEADRLRDANRHPGEVLLFVLPDQRPGGKVLDYAAGSGYFTRLFSAAVGPQGHVYATVPTPLLKFKSTPKSIAEVGEYAGAHPNVSLTVAAPLDAARAPEALDVFFVSQFYHDLHDPFMGPVDMAAFNRTVYAGLKPGGLYVVLDHVAAPGSPAGVTDTLHRIEPGVARREIEAAGFEFVAESPVLANPADPRAKDPFDPSIRGKTDQFLMKFKKPVTPSTGARVEPSR